MAKARSKKSERGTKPASKRKHTKRAARRGGRGTTRREEVQSSAEAEASDPFQLRDDQIEHLLVTGEERGLLEEYFGEAEYAALQALARESARRGVRGGPRVLILPGIMGSKIGRVRKLFFDDVIWIDPFDVMRGNLRKLALPDSKYKAVGVILFAYLKLKLRLNLAGYDADFHPFDWRRSLSELGKELSESVKNEPDEVRLVAHSMGGLVARAALAIDGAPKVSRLIMLGTPNFGSFAPVQAVRATYSMVRKVAGIDLSNTAEDLAEKVFKTFPGLHEMLPFQERFNGVDLYQAHSWPGDAPVPRQAMLDAVPPVQRRLAPADSRFYLIAGVNQDTTTGLFLRDGKFHYEQSLIGDGTVPLDFAELPGTTTYYIEESHGSLPNNGTVAAAVIDLLQTGETKRLRASWDRSRTRARRVVSEDDLRIDPYAGRRLGKLSLEDRRRIIEEVASPRSSELEVVTPRPEVGAVISKGYGHSIRDVSVTRRRAHSVEICLALGSITEVPCQATVLGLFQDVEPAGAAAAIDERLDGAIKEFTTRRMFSGIVGEVFAMPTGRHLLYAESILFAGLGGFDAFTTDVQQFVAENVVRTCIQTHVTEFASVLIGANTGVNLESIVYNQLHGYFEAIQDVDHNHSVRRIILCESNEARYLKLKEEVYRLASTSLFDGMDVTFDEMRLPEPPAVAAVSRRARVTSEARLAYLIVNQEEAKSGKLVFKSSLLYAGDKAAILTGYREVQRSVLDKQLTRIEQRTFTTGTLGAFGSKLASMVLDDSVARGLVEMQNFHLVIVHDAASSRVPWETICLDGWFPSSAKGLSRRYAAADLSVAKWSERRRLGSTLEVLLVVNPTQDLPGAEEEGERVENLFTSDSAVRITKIAGGSATRPALLAAFKSGKYDVVHYAGHAFFDPEVPARSGVLCHGREVLSGADLAGVGSLPALLFFNACESARVRRGDLRKDATLDIRRRLDRNIGLAEAFLRGGAANFVGTYWPVGDAPAKSFAGTFYKSLLGGKAIGEALQEGRVAVRDLGSVDWVDYIHYGAYDFCLKKI